jgi:hypothetical protein
MLDQDDLKWIATTSTELNSMLQQIARYADLARQHKGDYNYVEMLGERVELASKRAQELFDRVTSRILEGSTAKSKTAPDAGRPPQFKVVRSAAETASAKTPVQEKPSAAKAVEVEKKKTADAPLAIPPEITTIVRRTRRRRSSWDSSSICSRAPTASGSPRSTRCTSGRGKTIRPACS